ncbi:MAG: hypothetical protein AABW65_03180 [Nanoarchaeota archaeon]
MEKKDLEQILEDNKNESEIAEIMNSFYRDSSLNLVPIIADRVQKEKTIKYLEESGLHQEDYSKLTSSENREIGERIHNMYKSFLAKRVNENFNDVLNKISDAGIGGLSEIIIGIEPNKEIKAGKKILDAHKNAYKLLKYQENPSAFYQDIQEKYKDLIIAQAALVLIRKQPDLIKELYGRRFIQSQQDLLKSFASKENERKYFNSLYSGLEDMQKGSIAYLMGKIFSSIYEKEKKN